MKITKHILVAALFMLVLSSCKKEVCPTPFCTMEFSLTAPRQAFSPEDPIRSLAAFLRNDMTGDVIGPIDFDMAGRVEQVDLPSQTTYSCSVKQPLPYGNYTMWLWANVGDSEVYSFDHFSLKLRNNYVGGDYLLGKARAVVLDKRHDEISFDLDRVTAAVDIIKGSDIDQGVSLYVDNVYGKVDALGAYDDAGSRLEFEDGLYDGVPPVRFFTFPTSSSSASSVSLSYTTAGNATISNDTKTVNIVAGAFEGLSFGVPVIP